MASFIDHEAEVSDDEEEEGGAPAKKKSKKAIVSSDEEEEAEDDEAQIRKEMGDFVVSGDEEEEDGEKEDESDENEDEIAEDLDEEDLRLLDENLGTSIAKKKSRVRLPSDDEDEGDDRSRIQKQLFGGEEAEGEVEEGEDERRVADEDEEVRSSGSEDDADRMDNFIVGDEVGPARPRMQRRRGMPFSEDALRDAQDIFGADFQEWFLRDEGEEEEEGEEGEEMEREPDEDGEFRRAVRPKKKATKQSLLQHIEPEELERGFLSEFDKRVQLDDKPERFQLGRVPVCEGENAEMVCEAEWIFENAFDLRRNTISCQDDQVESNATKDSKATCSKIKEALNFMRNQHFEVPFIAFYRKEYVEPELSINDLWKVYFWDEKWNQLQVRKDNLIKLTKRMKQFQEELREEGQEALPDDMRMVTDDDIRAAYDVDSIENLQDAFAHFSLYHGQDVPKMQQHEKEKRLAESNDLQQVDEDDLNTYKHAARKDKYSVCVAAGLAGFCAKFGLSPSQLAENFNAAYCTNEVEQYPFSPLETAQDYLTRQFDSPESVLEGAKFMVAKQLSVEPAIRKHLRKEFHTRAKIYVRPTKKGRKEIDENHPIYTKKYLAEKPVQALEKDEFIKLVQAEENKLITMTITCDTVSENDTQKWSKETVDLAYYRRDEYIQLVQDWNRLRDDTMIMCVDKIVTPLFIKELKTKLMQEAREFVVKECCHALYNWLKIGPYVPEDWDTEEGQDGVRVLGIAYTPERDQATFCALIDGDGEVIDHLRLVHFTKRRTAQRLEDRDLKEQDLKTLKSFIMRKKPHVIALSAENLDSLGLQKDIEVAIEQLVFDQALNRTIKVELVDNELAKVYQNSKIAQEDFRDFPILLRQAVSLARRLQDPLPEFCQMCTVDDEILCLSYHPLQDQLSKDDLKSALMLEFINRVNEVGVDINRCLDHSHTSSMLQFVCGLGPRKANYLIKLLKQNENLLENRTKLVTLCRMGPKVFMNCAGFIKIDTQKVADKTDAYVEVLDGSRVHPETYEWARKMAVDALEYDDTAEDANPASALEEILESPERLKELDLEAFADELQRQGFGNKLVTLYDIRAELNKRYKDLRQPFQTPQREDIFNMLTKETPTTFNVGKLVMGRVLYIVCKMPRDDDENPNPVRDDISGFWQCPLCLKNDFSELADVWTHFDTKNCPGQAVGVKVRLENGIMGFIPLKYLSDKDVKDPNKRVKPHMPLYCRVLKVDTERFQAELSCRTSDLLDNDQQFKTKKDQYYDQGQEDADLEEDQRMQQKKNKQTYVKRVIAHPQFENITYKEAEQKLQHMEVGDCIIRPSSKGQDHLTLTWKVADKVYQHIDIEEEMKEKPFTLGKLLKIRQKADVQNFEDLDEIIARFVTPMGNNAREIENHKYFLHHPENEEPYTLEHMEQILLDEKSTSRQNHIPYKFSVSRNPKFVGKFLLSYMPRRRAIHEYVTVTPGGFRFRDVEHRQLNDMLRWFKQHFMELPQRTPVDRSSEYGHAAMTPTAYDNLSRASHTPRSFGWQQQHRPAGLLPPMGYPTPNRPDPTPRHSYAAPESVVGAWNDNQSNADSTRRTTPRGGMDWADAAKNWASRSRN